MGTVLIVVLCVIALGIVLWIFSAFLGAIVQILDFISACVQALTRRIERRNAAALDAAAQRSEQPITLAGRGDAIASEEIPDGERFEISYRNQGGDFTVRTIRPQFVSTEDGTRYIEAYCELRGEVRTFNNDRIGWATNLQTGRAIADLGNYLLRHGY